MQIQINGKATDVPASHADAVEKRLGKLSERYRFLQEAHVTLGKQRNFHECEVTLHVKHQMLRAKERDPEITTALDKAIDKLEKQLDRHKGRLLGRSRTAEGRELPPLLSIPDRKSVV